MPDSPDVDAVIRRAAKAPALPPAKGAVVRVDNAEQLAESIANARPDSTILVADGTYRMPLGVTLTEDDVTIRSESGNRDAVILDGCENHMDRDTALLQVKGAKRALIADLTFKNSKKYGILFYGDSDVRGLKVYNAKFHNIWARGLKGTTAVHPDDSPAKGTYPPETVEKVRPRNGEVRYCLFIVDHEKTDRDDGFDGDYISGMDMVYLANWTIADNAFIGIRGRNGGGRGAIFVWVESRDIVMERNVFIGNDRSIALGNPSYEGVSVRRAVVRDNCIVAGVNRAIECCGTRDVRVCNNRIYATHMEYPLTVEFTRGSDGGHCHHNIIHGHLVAEDSVRCEHNHVGEFEGAFADPSTADLNLTDKGRELFGVS